MVTGSFVLSEFSVLAHRIHRYCCEVAFDIAADSVIRMLSSPDFFMEPTRESYDFMGSGDPDLEPLILFGFSSGLRLACASLSQVSAISNAYVTLTKCRFSDLSRLSFSIRL